ncbi:MAG: dephospho-CoA kinase [Pseudomonadota bacterium]
MASEKPRARLPGPWRVGLTGGIGSGKSTVADLFAEHGVPVIDTDRVARDVVAPGTPGLADVAARFGPDVLADDGSLDRAALRRRVFRDDRARAELEALLHPRIRAAVDAASAEADGPYLLLVIPLLLEKGWQASIHRILVADAAPEDQIRRTMARDQISREEVEAILAAQVDRESRLAAADDVIDTRTDLDTLARHVAELDRRYRRLAPEDTGEIP